MKFTKISCFILLLVCSNYALALAVDEWEYKVIKGNLKPTAGCKNKELAAKQASTGYRFDKYTKLLCTSIAYGWSRKEVLDRGKLICESCEGDFNGEEKFRCYMEKVTVKCRTVKKGF